MMRHYNGAPRAVLRPLSKRNGDKCTICGRAFIKRRFSKLEAGEVNISVPSQLFDYALDVCPYGDSVTTIITANTIGVPIKYDMLIGKFEFRRGVACFDAQLYPENAQDILLITDKNILDRNYGEGLVGLSIGTSSIYALVVPIDLLVGGKIPLIKMSKVALCDELRRQIDAFLRKPSLS